MYNSVQYKASLSLIISISFTCSLSLISFPQRERKEWRELWILYGLGNGTYVICHVCRKSVVLYLKLSGRQGVSFFFSLLTTVLCITLNSHQWLLSKIMDLGLAEFLQVEVAGAGSRVFQAGKREPSSRRQESKGWKFEYLPFILCDIKKQLPVIYILLCRVIT